MSRKYSDQFKDLIGPEPEDGEEAPAPSEAGQDSPATSSSPEAPPDLPPPETPDEPSQDVEPAYKTPTANTAGRALRDVFSERDRLATELSSGRGRIVEIDPDVIDPSPFSDRLPDDDDADFVRFRQSIQDAGQKVPAAVRVHPDASERYQTVYGHRRIRAAQDLGIKVKAVILEVSDRDLLLSQALENNERQDLSWSEKALFVQQMDAKEIPTSDIVTAVGVDRYRVTDLRSVVKAIPTDIIKAIGRSPKFGRTKWKLLESAYASNTEVGHRALDILSEAAQRGISSDDRFQLLLSELQAKDAERRKAPSPNEIGKAVTSAVGEDDRADFADFVRHEIPAMVKRFYSVRRSAD